MHFITLQRGMMQRLNGLELQSDTFDNGKEFSEHQKISNLLVANIYFANPYHYWERGLNENTAEADREWTN